MNPWQLDPLHITVRLLLALVLGGMVGYERERHSSAAGFRTHILVCLGSALVMLLSAYGFSQFAEETNVRMDPARLAASVISGIGFLGAGTILRTGMSITGLTTAASLWVVAAIGLAVGAGFYYPAVLTTWMVLISLWVLSIVEKRFFRENRNYSLVIRTGNSYGILGEISSLLEKKGISVKKIVLEETENQQNGELKIALSVKIPKSSLLTPMVEDLRRIESVRGVSLE